MAPLFLYDSRRRPTNQTRQPNYHSVKRVCPVPPSHFGAHGATRDSTRRRLQRRTYVTPGSISIRLTSLFNPNLGSHVTRTPPYSGGPSLTSICSKFPVRAPTTTRSPPSLLLSGHFLSDETPLPPVDTTTTTHPGSRTPCPTGTSGAPLDDGIFPHPLPTKFHLTSYFPCVDETRHPT